MAKPKKTAPQKSETLKPAKPAGGIDPANSAAAAAAMVGRKVSTATPDNAPRAESSVFRNLKQSLNRSSSQTMGGLLDKTSSPHQKKGGPAHGGNSNVSHNQTFGADVSRRNVPRRTAG